MVDLFSHNIIAYESAIEMLLDTSKMAVIHLTEEGKSFPSFRLCEDNLIGRVLWLSLSEYIFKTQSENLKAVSNGYCQNNIIFCADAKFRYMRGNEIAEIKSTDYTDELINRAIGNSDLEKSEYKFEDVVKV